MTSQPPLASKPVQVSQQTGRVIAGPIAANIAFVMELTLVPLLLPAIQQQFGLSVSELVWVFNAYAIAVAIGVLLGGWSGDAFNTKTVFSYGLAFFAAGSLLVSAAESFELVIIGRALQGLGAGIFSPLLPVLLARASPQKPGRMLIFWGSIAGYVAALAPLFYGIAFDESDWNIAFIFIASIAILGWAVLKLSNVPDDGSTGAKADRKYSKLFQVRHLWLTFVYVFCTYGAITYYLFQLPILLSTADIKAASVGFLLTILWLTFSGMSAVLRNLVDTPHLKTIMFAAPFLILTGVLLSYFDQNFWVLALSSVLVGSGLACSNAPSTQLVLRFAPNGMSAISTSLDITFARLGGIATVAFLADVQFLTVALAMCLLGVLAAVCAIATNNEFNGMRVVGLDQP
ncbi:MAG: MFS transporter [Pseudomonadota bacterium]